MNSHGTFNRRAITNNGFTQFLIYVFLFFSTVNPSVAQFNSPPKPEDAFKVDIISVEPGLITAEWRILDKIYMYDDKFLATSSNPDVKIGTLTTPQGEIENDPLFGEVEIHWKQAVIKIPYTSDKNSDTTLTLGGQGCHKEMGICYSPVEHSFEITLTSTNSNGEMTPSDGANQKESRSLFLSIGIAFLSGLALSLTPCVLPLVPILAGIVMGGASTTTPFASRISKGIIYILGTIISYAIIGAFAGYTGTQLQAWLQSTWTTLFLIAILVIMAAAMFGLLKIQMPSWLTNRLDTMSKGRGGYVGILILGITSALMVGACVTPILIGVISGIIATGSPLYGALIMSSLALGMGVPLLLVCFGAAKWLPKSGAWMNAVNHVLGWGLLIVSAWLASSLLPINPLWPFALLALTASLYCAWLAKSTNQFSLIALTSIFGIIAGIYVAGAYQGNTELLKPLQKRGIISEHYEAPMINSQQELDSIIANNPNTKILVDFRADWCTDCIRFERATLSDPNVIKALETVGFYQIDITKPKGSQAEVQKKYGVYGPPAIMIFDGTPTPEIKYGYLDAKTFLAIIEN